MLFPSLSIVAAIGINIPVYVAWLVAWRQLGHAPHPGYDAPARLGGWATFLHEIGSPLVYAGFGLFLASVALTLMWNCCLPRRDCKRTRVRLLLGLVLFVATIGIAQWDPVHAVEWWFS